MHCTTWRSAVTLLQALLALLALSSLVQRSSGQSVSHNQNQNQNQNLPRTNVNDLNYTVFPRRLNSEAAVIEWGHSAVINAVDAVAAQFGAQPHSGAFFEVEATPVLADPVDARVKEGQMLNNCDELSGNIAVVTSSDEMSYLDLALVAQSCEAAALVVVSIVKPVQGKDPAHREPDYIFAMGLEDGEDAGSIDFPCVMISLDSGNMLASAGKDGKSMPDRVRLYSGGDRPFFEDVNVQNPMVYLIHNLVSTAGETDHLVKLAEGKFEEFDGTANYLEGTEELGGREGGRSAKAKLDRVYLWKGRLLDPKLNAIDERITQVTGFPIAHISDWQVNR